MTDTAKTDASTAPINQLAAAAAASKPGLKTSELWLTTAAGGGITQIVTTVHPFELPHALACLSLAILVGCYTAGRAVAKRATVER